MEQDRCAVVFDVGSCSTRVGLSGDTTPIAFKTVVSKENDKIIVGDGTKRVLDGSVLDWDNWTKVIDHGFKVRKIDSENHPVILNKPSMLFWTSQHEKMAQILFEEFNIPALHLNYSAVLSMRACGCQTGLVVDSGFFETQFYPIYEGQLLHRAITRGFEVAGNYLTWFLCDSLKKRGFDCSYNLAEQIKEKYISTGVTSKNVTEKTLSLLNVTLSTEKNSILEELYKPSFLECAGIEEYLIQTLYRCDPQLQKNLIENIVLTGGNTLLPGFAERLEQELIKALPKYKFFQDFVPKIEKNNDINAVWTGGAKLASLSTFPDMCMTKDGYNEYGPTLVKTKFF